VQAQAHYQNNTLYYCHTSCDLLNAGTVEAQFVKIKVWLDKNPYEVLTILLGNYDFVSPDKFVAPLQSSGLMNYVYTPPKFPMALGDWPALGQMILSGKRLVVFMDYQASPSTLPYILDEFSQLWETPFSPTDASFPCTAQRPPGMTQNQTLDRMYMANHNLNVDVQILGASILIPDVAQVNTTNAISGYGSLGAATTNCTGKSIRAALVE
jgi:hypothetical protein